MNKDSKLMTFLRGIIMENPVLILILGTCPTLAMTTSVVSSFSMGIAATLVLIGSNAVISALRKIIPDSVRIPCYIVIIATFVTAVQMILQAAAPSIYDALGVYLALIVVNCIILGAGAFAGIEIPFLASIKIPILVQAPGGFLVYGILIAIMNKITEKRGGVKRKSFSCEGCPTSHLCNKTSCDSLAGKSADDSENNVKKEGADNV